MTSLKVWLRARLDTPDKARTTLSNIALGGGILGSILTVVSVIAAQT